MKETFLFLFLLFSSIQIQPGTQNLKTPDRQLQSSVGSASAEIMFNGQTNDSISNFPDRFFRGDNGYTYFGWAQSEYSGDVNGDGFDDLLIRSFNYLSLNDRINLFLGGSIVDSNSDQTFTAEYTENDYLRGNISILKDVNGDGFDDILIGSPCYNNRVGRAYLYFGGNNVNNTIDLVIESPTGGAFGNSVSSAGDVNGDGYGDIIIGAYGFQSGNPNGGAFLYYGGPNIDNNPDVVFVGAGGYFGQEVSDAGDVNADGYDDIIVGAPLNSAAYIFFGGVLMNNSPDVTFLAGGETGNSVSAAGDVNSDGYDDVLIGDLTYDSYTGRSFLLLGGANMNSSSDVTFYGTIYGGKFGCHVSNCGDVNSDGFDDVLIGSFYANRIDVFFGGQYLDSQSDFMYTDESGAFLGYHVGAAGDVNGDGTDDIIAGQPSYFSGRSLLFLGSSNSELELVSPTDNSNGLNLNVEFLWKKFQNASFYKLIVATDTDFENIVYEDSTIADTLKTVYMHSYATNYFWRVQARDTLGNLKSSAIWNFSTRERPTVQLNHPSNNSANISLSDSMSWNSYPNTTMYRIMISLDSTFQNVVFVDSVFNDTSIAVSGFSYLTKYFWKVGAKDTSGLFYYSDVWNFTTIARPLVQLIRPIDDSLNASTNMNFVWGSVPYATSYRLQIAIDSTFNNVQYNYTGLNDTSKLVLGLSHNQRYFWRVGAKELTGPTYYSSYIDFTTMPQLKLNVTVLMEGMYFPLFNQLSRRDSVRVILRESNAPYSAVDSVTATIDSLNYTGLFVFPKASAGRYYIVVKHFNCVETWSSAGGEELIGGITNAYNFTTSASQAYGSNLKLRGGKYCMYSGDINQSGFIDGSDLSELDNGAYNLLSGRFLPTDLNGDNFSDGTDFVIGDNNRSYIGVITP